MIRKKNTGGAVRLTAAIRAIEESEPQVKALIEPMYRDARAAVIGAMQGCDDAQAKRVNDAALERFWEQHQNKIDAEKRKAEQERNLSIKNQKRQQQVKKIQNRR